MRDSKTLNALAFIFGMIVLFVIMAFTQHVFGQKTKPQIGYSEHSLISTGNDSNILNKVNIVYVVDYNSLELYTVKAVHIDPHLGYIAVTVVLNMDKFYCEQRLINDELYFFIQPYLSDRYYDQDEAGLARFPDKRQLVSSYEMHN